MNKNDFIDCTEEEFWEIVTIAAESYAILDRSDLSLFSLPRIKRNELVCSLVARNWEDAPIRVKAKFKRTS